MQAFQVITPVVQKHTEASCPLLMVELVTSALHFAPWLVTRGLEVVQSIVHC